MPNSPLVSVVLSSYNVENFVEDSVKSLLKQSYGNIEVLLIDDGSTDSTWENAQNLINDSRMRLYRNERNLGVTKSINSIAGEVRGEYVARMDADDIAFPDRIEVQLRELQQGGYDVLGGWMTVFGDGKERIQRYPESHDAIASGLLFTSMFSQPTVMMKTETFIANPYRESSGILEDYDLWTQLALRGYRLRNLRRPLVRHRRHPSQTSSSKRSEQWEIAGRISIEYLDSLGIAATDEEKLIHVGIRSPRTPESLMEIRNVEKWIGKLVHFFEGKADSVHVLANIWYRYCLKSSTLGLNVFREFERSQLTTAMGPKAWQHAALFALCAGRVGVESALYRRLSALSPAAWMGHYASRR